jgi:hypothetical protein
MVYLNLRSQPGVIRAGLNHEKIYENVIDVAFFGLIEVV